MSMIEKVARAMCEADNGAGYDARWDFYIPMAKAAIHAMRDPTEAMLDAGHSQTDFAGDAWQSMIDAALEEG